MDGRGRKRVIVTSAFYLGACTGATPWAARLIRLHFNEQIKTPLLTLWRRERHFKLQLL